MKTKLLLAACCGIAGLVAAAYALAANDGSRRHATPPVQATIGPWRALDAAGLGTHALGAARATGAGQTAEIAGLRAADGSYVGIVRDSAQGLRFSALSADPGNTGASTHLLHSLGDLSFINRSLGLLSLEQRAAPDGSVARISGAGVVRTQATGAQLELLDGSHVSLPLVDLGGGARGFAFLAADPKRFPTAIQALNAAGQVVAEFRFDPTAHP
jgi:hypothetical protein